jgi:hypothetical protein
MRPEKMLGVGVGSVDERVAELLFGFRWVACVRTSFPYEADCAYLLNADLAAGLLREWPDYFEQYRGTQRRQQNPFLCFSHGVAAAFEVVEAMRSRGWGLSLEMEPHPPFDWFAQFTGEVNGVKECAPSAPMAICLAALRSAACLDVVAALSSTNSTGEK